MNITEESSGQADVNIMAPHHARHLILITIEIVFFFFLEKPETASERFFGTTQRPRLDGAPAAALRFRNTALFCPDERSALVRQTALMRRMRHARRAPPRRFV